MKFNKAERKIFSPFVTSSAALVILAMCVGCSTDRTTKTAASVPAATPPFDYCYIYQNDSDYGSSRPLVLAQAGIISPKEEILSEGNLYAMKNLDIGNLVFVNAEKHAKQNFLIIPVGYEEDMQTLKTNVGKTVALYERALNLINGQLSDGKIEANFVYPEKSLPVGLVRDGSNDGSNVIAKLPNSCEVVEFVKAAQNKTGLNFNGVIIQLHFDGEKVKEDVGVAHYVDCPRVAIFSDNSSHAAIHEGIGHLLLALDDEYPDYHGGPSNALNISSGGLFTKTLSGEPFLTTETTNGLYALLPQDKKPSMVSSGGVCSGDPVYSFGQMNIMRRGYSNEEVGSALQNNGGSTDSLFNSWQVYVGQANAARYSGLLKQCLRFLDETKQCQ